MDSGPSRVNNSYEEKERQDVKFLFVAPIHLHEKLLDILFKMSTTHEIALDYNFRLGNFNEPQNSLSFLISDALHNAFWNALEEELSQDPPKLDCAILLLNDIKESLNQVVLPQQKKLKQEIEDLIDTDFIKQQAEHGVFNFQEYSQYIISLMARLCAPVRDDEIKALSEIHELIPALRGLMEILNKMKMDMVNFKLDTIKADILVHSVDIEKDKFHEFLEIKGDGIPITEGWLKNHKPQNSLDSKEVNACLHKAFLDLLDWKSQAPFPETLILDHQRFLKMQESFFKIIVLSSILIVIFSSLEPELCNDGNFKQELKKNIGLLIDDVKSEKSLVSIIPNIIEQVVKESNNKLQEKKLSSLPESSVQILQKNIEHLTDPNHAVRFLVKTRVCHFLCSTLEVPPGELHVPPALSNLKEELMVFGRRYQQIVSYNIKVYKQYYSDILAAA